MIDVVGGTDNPFVQITGNYHKIRPFDHVFRLLTRFFFKLPICLGEFHLHYFCAGAIA